MMTYTELYQKYFELVIQFPQARKFAMHEHRWYDVISKIHLPEDYSQLYGAIDGFIISYDFPTEKKPIFLVGKFGTTLNQLGGMFDRNTAIILFELQTNWRDYGTYLFGIDGWGEL